MSSTGGGGGGGGGGVGFLGAGAGAEGFFLCVPLVPLPGFELPGFELLAAGFFAGGFEAAGSADQDNGAQTTANAAADTRARAREASMGDDSTGRAPLLTNWLEPGLHGQAQRARLHRVEMTVFHRLRFARQPALVEICDVVVA